jgi:hypothetical protein
MTFLCPPAFRSILAVTSILTFDLLLLHPAKAQVQPFVIEISVDANQLFRDVRDTLGELVTKFNDMKNRGNWPIAFKDVEATIADKPDKFNFNLTKIGEIVQKEEIRIVYTSSNWKFSGILSVDNRLLQDKIWLSSAAVFHLENDGPPLNLDLEFSASTKEKDTTTEPQEKVHGEGFLDKAKAAFQNIQVVKLLPQLHHVKGFVFNVEATHEKAIPRVIPLPSVSNIDIDPIDDFPLRANADFFIDLILDRSHEPLVASSVSSLSYQLLYDSTELLFDRFEPYTSIFTIPNTCIPNCIISQGFSAPVAGGDGPINLGRYYFNAKNPEDWPGDGLSDVSFANFVFKDLSGFELTDYQVSPAEFELQLEQVPGPAPFLGIFAAAFHARRLRSLRERMRLCTNKRL